jgi:hypothetical protein
MYIYTYKELELVTRVDVQRTVQNIELQYSTYIYVIHLSGLASCHGARKKLPHYTTHTSLLHVCLPFRSRGTWNFSSEVTLTIQLTGCH